MRLVSSFFVCACLTAGAHMALRAQTAPADAASVMAATREALGGEKKIAAVKTVVATGRTRQVQGDNLVPIEFEINIELPDKYVRTDEIPARESGPTTRGFNGAELIQSADAAGGRGAPPRREGAPAPAMPAAEPGAVRGGGPPPDPTTPLRQDFVRLTLGMFATSFSTYPLTFSYAGAAEAPEGKAEVIDVKGPANFSARLFINSQSHLPLMLSWAGPPNAARGPAPPPAQTGPVENRIYYADYRDVDGLKFPFRIRRAVGATTTEETVFDRFRINAKIDPRKFEVRR